MTLSVEVLKKELIAAGIEVHRDMKAPAEIIAEDKLAMAYSVKIEPGGDEKSLVKWIIETKNDPKNFAFYRHDHDLFPGREIIRFAVW